MNCRILETQIHILNVRTRLPFRYGIATMTVLPHLFLRLKLEVDGQIGWGIAADHLPPKWFTKNPVTSYAEDVAEMLQVIDSACSIATVVKSQSSLFQLWMEIYRSQQELGKPREWPALLLGFGVSLVERAMIDAFCRIISEPFGNALRKNSFGIRLGSVHPELKNVEPGQLLPGSPLTSIHVRHTVGLSDPLTLDDRDGQNSPDDGLPVTLEENIQNYGLSYFKIKIMGNPEQDLDRLKKITRVIRQYASSDYFITLDGNEQYQNLAEFRTFWEACEKDSEIGEFLTHLIFVEQPLHRNRALSQDVVEEFRSWQNHPRLVIDESDGSPGDFRRALEMGYCGTSHKNCKGVFKGIANACLLQYRLKSRGNGYILSGEDLTNIGPISLLQDLCVMSHLGIQHAERNGHQYFRGMDFFPEEVQMAVLQAHPDLFGCHSQGFTCLKMERGQMNLASLHQSGLGTGFDFDSSQFVPRNQWSFDSLRKNESQCVSR